MVWERRIKLRRADQSSSVRTAHSLLPRRRERRERREETEEVGGGTEERVGRGRKGKEEGEGK